MVGDSSKGPEEKEQIRPKVIPMGKNLPADAGDTGKSLGREDALQEGMATHCSILAWRIPMHRRAWWATVPRVAKSWTQLSD